MTHFTWPTYGDDHWDAAAIPNWEATWDLAAHADTTAMAAIGNTGGTFAAPGIINLDAMAGSSDDAKLTAAMNLAKSYNTVKPAIGFGARQYNFATAGRQLYSGLKLVGLAGHGDQQRGANSVPNDIRFTGSGTWWVNPGTTFDVYMGGLCFQGNSNAQFMSSNPGVLWTSVFENLGFNLWKHVMGNPGTKFLNTAILLTGWWNTNNSYNTAYTFGGSDSNFWIGGEALIDSQPGFMANGAYHVEFSSQQKSNIGPIYMTAETMSGIHIAGGTALVFTQEGRVEGRHANEPCKGACIRIDGGAGTFRDWWVSYGMTAPGGTGHSGEIGVITQTGGDWLYDGLWYDRASGVAETVPFIGVSGGSARVRNIRRSGSWSGLPRVDAAGGTVDADNSVTVV